MGRRPKPAFAHGRASAERARRRDPRGGCGSRVLRWRRDPGLRGGWHNCLSAKTYDFTGQKAEGRFGKQDFVYVAEDDVYRCPAGERLTYRYTSEEEGKTLRCYWTTACQACSQKAKCTTGKERRIKRWEHEAVLEKVQARLDGDPGKMRIRRHLERSSRGWDQPTSR